MEYTDISKYLRELEQKGAHMDLRTVACFIAAFPPDFGSTKIIQVAGTNGKGSTASFLTSILTEAGYKVGLFTSPHLRDYRESLSIDGQWIAPEHLAYHVTDIKRKAESLLEKKQLSGLPTYFETIFLVSLYYFLQFSVDVIILEAGMGGRSDATTSVTPHLSIITGVSHDHNRVLGKRIADIAAEKAGIIKQGVPVVCACSVYSVANRIIRKRAEACGAPFYNVPGKGNRLTVEGRGEYYHCFYATGEPAEEFFYDVYLRGEHQPRNAAVAIKAIQLLERCGITVEKDAVAAGIAKTRMPARLEQLPTTPPVLLDVGHNVESITGLRNYLLEKGKKKFTLIFGVLRDKNYRKMASLLLPLVDRVILTKPLSHRALPPAELKSAFSKLPSTRIFIRNRLNDALDTAKQWQKEIVITGSFYLVGEMRHMIINGEALKNG
ncbi:MAG: hypothetical protein GY765_21120 [bacterium]|nr:hypothetical protein [bacterium]